MAKRSLLLLCLLAAAACSDPKEKGPAADTGVDTDVAIDAGAPIDLVEPDTFDPPGPDPSEALFDPESLLEISVEIAPDDWDELRHQTRTFADILQGDCLAQPFAKIFTYFPATVTVDGEVFDNVGVRKKGFFGSLSNTKPSLKIKFDEYEEGQELLGLRRLTLNNSNQDPSHMNTCLVYKVYRDAGYPAARCNFARVTVNGDYLGVYIHVDSMKKPFLKRHFGDDEGNFYEGTLSDFNETFRYTFEKKTNKTENDFSDIEAATAALGTGGQTGLALLAGIFDVDRFLTFWAIEVLVGHWDGYTGNLNNFYIYVDPAVGKFVFLPWGPDSAYKKINNPFDEYNYPASVMANSTLSRRLYDDPTYRAAYQARMLELLETVWDEEALHAEAERMEFLLAPHIPGELLGAFGQGVSRIHNFINKQRKWVSDSVAANPDFKNAERTSPCITSVGTLKVSFETTWDSLDVAEPWSHGEVTYGEFTVGGATVTPGASGCTIGIGDEGPATGKVVLSLVNMMANGDLDILAFVMEPGLPGAGVTLKIDGKEVTGYALRLSPPYNGELQLLATLSSGWLKMDEFSQEEGAAVVGELEASIF